MGFEVETRNPWFREEPKGIDGEIIAIFGFDGEMQGTAYYDSIDAAAADMDALGQEPVDDVWSMLFMRCEGVLISGDLFRVARDLRDPTGDSPAFFVKMGTVVVANSEDEDTWIAHTADGRNFAISHEELIPPYVDLVEQHDRCLVCGECRRDWLVWDKDGETVKCASCGNVYTPPTDCGQEDFEDDDGPALALAA